MSREDEIAQGLREPGGALIGGLDAADYLAGKGDFDAGRPAPGGITSASYDLGRSRAREEAEQTADVLAAIDRQQEESRQRVRKLLAGRRASSPSTTGGWLN